MLRRIGNVLVGLLIGYALLELATGPENGNFTKLLWTEFQLWQVQVEAKGLQNELKISKTEGQSRMMRNQLRGLTPEQLPE